jgi:hypothetical protein
MEYREVFEMLFEWGWWFAAPAALSAVIARRRPGDPVFSDGGD